MTSSGQADFAPAPPTGQDTAYAQPPLDDPSESFPEPPPLPSPPFISAPLSVQRSLECNPGRTQASLSRHRSPSVTTLPQVRSASPSQPSSETPMPHAQGALPSFPPDSAATSTSPPTRRNLSTTFSEAAATRTVPSHAAARQQRGGRKSASRVVGGIRKRRKTIEKSWGRGSGFSRQEVDNLLELLEEHLPLSKEEWDHIVRLPSERYPEYKRTVDSLKRKFASLHRRRIPTGDPTIPLDVDKAKRIRYSMTERADIGEGEDSDDILCAFDSGDEEPETNPFDDGPSGAEVLHSADGAREKTPLKSPSPSSARPIVRKRGAKETPKSSSADLIELYKLQMMQDQARRDDDKAMRSIEREEEKKWRQEQREERLRREAEREEERKEKAAQRAEERAIRQEETKRHERMMEMLMMSLVKK
ncbi:hypothetical protein BWQ96_05925 [Gracilariopsis chorda]|uniref:DUF6818 domain-containing protein n=1 Tax=Gracilariopsis chorda TaxID=448386 RepID=A0A2V3IQD7_9FLOR|nr:hypothetical protein BWQ96_05925 [Gracilariopsis chorda]|eukprot:PXF44298.1 hypothetical protein BWQ96_05925 [Gracilariopsis chorda]